MRMSFFFLARMAYQNGVELGVHRVEYGDSILDSLLALLGYRDYKELQGLQGILGL